MVDLDIFFINYNLPPWLTSDPFFLMLLLIIPRNKSVTSDTINVYLEPLYDEPMELWKGIRDAHSIKFSLRSLLLFIIHGLLTRGTLTSLIVHGYCGCPACKFKDFVRNSNFLRKCIMEIILTLKWIIHIV